MAFITYTTNQMSYSKLFHPEVITDQNWNSVAKNDDEFSDLWKVWEIKCKKKLIFLSKISILGMESWVVFSIAEVHEVLLVFHFISEIMERVIAESHGLSIGAYWANQLIWGETLDPLCRTWVENDPLKFGWRRFAAAVLPPPGTPKLWIFLPSFVECIPYMPWFADTVIWEQKIVVSDLQNKGLSENADPWPQRKFLHEFMIFEIKHFKG